MGIGPLLTAGTRARTWTARKLAKTKQLAVCKRGSVSKGKTLYNAARNSRAVRVVVEF